MMDLLEEEQNKIIERAKKLNKIPNEIAINTPFRENILTMFICVFSRTPLFVCGKPGSSKTITVNILKRMFYSQKTKGKFGYYDFFPTIRMQYYQGSEQSTDKGIDRTFRKAIDGRKKYQELPLVFIDEIGLAELSDHNPLKVLHKYLDSTSHDQVDFDDFENENHMMDVNISDKRNQETPNQKQLRKWDLDISNKVAFIGISNWNIDASKMNRNVYLARPDLGKETLQKTGNIILKNVMTNYKDKDNKFKKEIRIVIMRLAESYHQFRIAQKVL
jgi:hypothetical protein